VGGRTEAVEGHCVKEKDGKHNTKRVQVPAQVDVEGEACLSVTCRLHASEVGRALVPRIMAGMEAGLTGFDLPRVSTQDSLCFPRYNTLVSLPIQRGNFSRLTMIEFFFGSTPPSHSPVEDNSQWKISHCVVSCGLSSARSRNTWGTASRPHLAHMSSTSPGAMCLIVGLEILI